MATRLLSSIWYRGFITRTAQTSRMTINCFLCEQQNSNKEESDCTKPRNSSQWVWIAIFDGYDPEQSDPTLNLFCFGQVFALQTSTCPSKLHFSLIENRRCCLCVIVTNYTRKYGFKLAFSVSDCFFGSHWLSGAILFSYTPVLLAPKLCA